MSDMQQKLASELASARALSAELTKKQEDIAAEEEDVQRKVVVLATGMSWIFGFKTWT